MAIPIAFLGKTLRKLIGKWENMENFQGVESVANFRRNTLLTQLELSSGEVKQTVSYTRTSKIAYFSEMFFYFNFEFL